MRVEGGGGRWRYKIPSKDVLPLFLKAGSSTESLSMVFKIQNHYTAKQTIKIKKIFKKRGKPLRMGEKSLQVKQLTRD